MFLKSSEVEDSISMFSEIFFSSWSAKVLSLLFSIIRAKITVKKNIAGVLFSMSVNTTSKTQFALLELQTLFLIFLLVAFRRNSLDFSKKYN